MADPKMFVHEETFKQMNTDSTFDDELVRKSSIGKRNCESQRLTPNPYELQEWGEEETRQISKEEKDLPEAKETHTWHHNAVTCLIRSMEGHYQNLSNPKKRKHVFENISNDLVSQGFSVNSHMVQNKWKSLLRSYKIAKDNKIRTGKGPSRFFFFEELDAILDNKPSNKCTFAFESSHLVLGDDSDNREPIPENLEEGLFTESFRSRQCTSTGLPMENMQCSTPTPSTRSSSAMSSDQSKGVKRNLNFKLLKEENKMTRHRERLNLEIKKIEIEERKLKLLEKYIEIMSKRAVGSFPLLDDSNHGFPKREA